MPRPIGDKRGFTLTELLVVVGIIVLLTAIVVPNITGRITVARMHAAEDQIAEIETALAAYYADFGTYPGDVFPTEDLNNNGVLDDGEDVGVDIDGDGIKDYDCKADGTPLDTPNGRLDRGDGVVNIDDLEWALKTTAKNGPYLKEIPLDPWGNKYVYYAPLTRPTNPNDYLYIDPTTFRSEDGQVGVLNGKLDTGEDIGIGLYATINTNVHASFTSKYAGAANKILDHGDDVNKDGIVQTYYSYSISTDPGYPTITYPADPGAPQRNLVLELGNADVSPDGLARNAGYYIYSIGRNKKDETAVGYEDIGSLNGNGSPDNFLNRDYSPDPVGNKELWTYTREAGTAARFSEDIDTDESLDTGYEDTGLDGIPGTKDRGEDNGILDDEASDPSPPATPRNEDFGTGAAGVKYHYNTMGTLDGLNSDDINSWNKKKPWRDHPNYGG